MLKALGYLTLAGVLMLAGCSGADDTGADSSPTPTPSSTPSPFEGVYFALSYQYNVSCIEEGTDTDFSSPLFQLKTHDLGLDFHTCYSLTSCDTSTWEDWSLSFVLGDTGNGGYVSYSYYNGSCDFTWVETKFTSQGDGQVSLDQYTYEQSGVPASSESECESLADTLDDSRTCLRWAGLEGSLQK